MSAPRRGYKVKLPARNLSEIRVIPRLPDRLDPAKRGNTFPADLIGATIVKIGAAPPELDLEGGGPDY